MNKYGLKAVAEKKFMQVISSCILLKDTLPRIRLFGRFLEVFEELPTRDYNRYQDMVEMY